MNILIVMVGGASGAMLRYAFGLFLMKRFSNQSIPIAMLVVNIVGSLGLGLFLGSYFREFASTNYENSLFLFIGLGFFGAFTTFSTFSVETTKLLVEKKIKEAIIYVGLSITFSILLFIVGFSVVSLWYS